MKRKQKILTKNENNIYTLFISICQSSLWANTLSFSINKLEGWYACKRNPNNEIANHGNSNLFDGTSSTDRNGVAK